MKLVQNRDGVGPYGAKGGGEGAVNPIGAVHRQRAVSGHWRAHPDAAAHARARLESACRRRSDGAPSGEVQCIQQLEDSR